MYRDADDASSFAAPARRRTRNAVPTRGRLKGPNLHAPTPRRSQTRAATRCLIFLCLLGPGVAQAAPVSISNPGFEALYLGSNLPPEYAGDVPTGTFPTGPPPSGWTPYYEGGSPPPGAFIGVLNPGSAADFAPDPAFFDLGAPEGDNAVLLYTSGDTGGAEYGVEQTLGAVLQADVQYTLSVEVGNIGSATALLPPYSNLGFFNIEGFPGYRLQLLAGGALLAEDVDTVLPAEREWETATLVFSATESHLQLDQPLTVRLVNRNQPDVAGVTGIEVDFDDVQLDATPLSAVPIGPVARLAAGLGLLAIGSRMARRVVVTMGR